MNMRDFYPQWHDMQISIREVTDENAETEMPSTLDADNPQLIQSSSSSTSAGDSTPIVTFPSDDHSVANMSYKRNYDLVFSALEQVHRMPGTDEAFLFKAESAYRYWTAAADHMKLSVPSLSSMTNVAPREHRKHFREAFRPSCYRALAGVRSRTISKCPLTHIESKYKICPSSSVMGYSMPVNVQQALYGNRRNQRWSPVSRRAPCRRREARTRAMQGFSFNIELSTVNEVENESDGDDNSLEKFSTSNPKPSMFKDIQVSNNALAIQGIPRSTSFSDFEEELCVRLNQLPVVENDPDIIRSLRQSLQSFHFSNKAQKE